MSTSSGDEWSSGTSGLTDPSDSAALPASDAAFAETGRDDARDAAADDRADTGREETFDLTEAGLEEVAERADLADLAERADSGRDSSAMSPAPVPATN